MIKYLLINLLIEGGSIFDELIFAGFRNQGISGAEVIVILLSAKDQGFISHNQDTNHVSLTELGKQIAECTCPSCTKLRDSLLSQKLASQEKKPATQKPVKGLHSLN